MATVSVSASPQFDPSPLPFESNTSKSQSNSQTPQSLHLSLLNQCKTTKHLQQIHAHMIKTQHQRHVSKLLTSICLSPVGPMDYALSIFSRIDGPDIFTWNTMIRGYIRISAPHQSLLLFAQMLESSVFPNAYTFPFVLKACAHLSSIHRGRSVHAQLLKHGLASDLHISTALISFYAACGDPEAAHQVFVKCPYTTTSGALWNAVISGFVKSGHSKHALELFDQMLQIEGEEVRADGITIVSALSACADLGALDAGEWIHDYAIKNGIRLDVFVGTALVEVYAKCGCIELACKVFDEMCERNVMSWTVMIRGLAMCGHGGDALALFSNMIEEGVKPDGITFLGVLSACSHSGLVDEGRRIFSSMTRDFGIVPKSEHYSCMADLLSRAGMLSEAIEFIETMPLEPDAALWGSMLSACRRNPKEVKLAEYVAGHLMEIEPYNDATYVLLSNIYAYNNRWDDVSRVRKLMKQRAIRKTPGCSFIEVNGVIHEFIAGDRSHPRFEEIYGMVEEVTLKLEESGYVMDTSEVLLDIEEDEKRSSLLLHSEKLALAFGLISTHSLTSVRIVKNLRVCNDCHTMMKDVSRVYQREIVLRDRNRFHRFRDGSCSCSDFW
eukprot:TRINITY_DN6003_c1_g1_i1.p1 TRINITY_DN6003_c1_g1~~TRINITY_DN6003_c1_g1_i1.p1  ORF type:complete len:611 (-),score=69.79 TRINITY_DN6003_c1_g1_i1:95-1927(-)